MFLVDICLLNIQVLYNTELLIYFPTSNKEGWNLDL